MKLAQIAGAKVIAIDMNEQRLQYAKEKIGVDYTVKEAMQLMKLLN